MTHWFQIRQFCDRTAPTANVELPQPSTESTRTPPHAQLLGRWVYLRWVYLISGLISGLCLTLPLWTIPAAAQFVPPDAGLPGRRASGGTRGGCVIGSPSNVIALLPDSNVGHTTQAFPTFRWYMPQSSAEAMRFRLYAADPNQADSAGVLIYETVQPAPSDGEIVSLTLPQTGEAQPLITGRTYRWSVDLLCNATNPASNPNITGWVQRITLDPAISPELADADREERVDIYGANGIWFDYLDAIAALSLSDQEQADALWLETLTSIGLDELASLYGGASSDTSAESDI